MVKVMMVEDLKKLTKATLLKTAEAKVVVRGAIKAGTDVK
jgi:hypothetical protein